jgi:hypothetical protein
MNLSSTAITTVIALVTSMSAVEAQTSLSGTWIFKSQESISGNLYSNGSPKSLTIKQDAKSITMEKTTAGNGGDVTNTEIANFDGQPVQMTTASKRKKTITATWSSDKKSLTEIVQIYDATDSNRLFHLVTDVWSLAGGGLVLDRKDENKENGEIWESKATYSKQ